MQFCRTWFFDHDLPLTCWRHMNVKLQLIFSMFLPECSLSLTLVSGPLTDAEISSLMEASSESRPLSFQKTSTRPAINLKFPNGKQLHLSAVDNSACTLKENTRHNRKLQPLPAFIVEGCSASPATLNQQHGLTASISVMVAEPI